MPSTMGSRIKEIRNALNLSQEEFGQILNSGKSYVSAVENDKSKLSLENLVKLLMNHGANINYILCGIGSPFLDRENKSLKDEIIQEVRNMLKNEGIIK